MVTRHCCIAQLSRTCYFWSSRLSHASRETTGNSGSCDPKVEYKMYCAPLHDERSRSNREPKKYWVHDPPTSGHALALYQSLSHPWVRWNSCAIVRLFTQRIREQTLPTCNGENGGVPKIPHDMDHLLEARFWLRTSRIKHSSVYDHMYI